MVDTVTVYSGTVPQRGQEPTVFRPAADAWVKYQADTMIPDFNTSITQLNSDLTQFNTDLVTVEGYKDDAEAAANAAEAASNATEWQPDPETYNAGEVVWSSVDYQSYRNKTGTNTTEDPNTDTDNWQLLGQGAAWQEVITTNGVSEPMLFEPVDTTSGPVTRTMPPSIAIGDTFVYQNVGTANELTLDKAVHIFTRQGQEVDSSGDGNITVLPGRWVEIVCQTAGELEIVAYG